jgi:HK97 family phage major capsid protein
MEETNALKTISKTDDELRVANYIALFGGRDLTSFAGRSIKPNQDGSLGEFFTPNTDFESNYTKTGMLYVDFEHSLDPDDLGVGRDDILGYVDWKTAKKDERGLFVERVLNRRQKYVQWLEELIDAGLIGNSSEAVGSQVEKKSNGEIVKWGLRRDTLTVNPMEPRMLSDNQLQAVKALAEVMPEFKSLITPQAAGSDTGGGNAIAAQTAKENIEMEANEIKALLDEQKTALAELVKTEAEAAAAKAVENVLDKLPEVKAKMNGQVEGVKDEADQPFKTVGENLQAIVNQVRKGHVAPRMKALHEMNTKAILGNNETVPSQGQFLLEPTLVADFLKPVHEEGPFSSRVKRMPVGSNSNYGWINGVDETSRATGSRWGGVRGYWLSEGDTLTASQPKFRRINWELHKLAVLMYATDEILADTSMLNSIIAQSAAEELMFLCNDAILRGTGAGQCLGILNSAAVISAVRTNATNIDHDDILRMVARTNSRQFSNSVWFANPDIAPEIDSLNFTAGTNGILSPYVTYTADGVTMLRGRPVIYNEFSPTLGSVGDLLLADLSDYLFWEKGGVEAAASIHVQFLTDQTAFRFIYRCDGQPATYTAKTRYQSTDTESPYIALAATT